ncbi:hypothetical protein ABZ252_35300 [Streptomyces sp. NPDC006175]|uniref:hypothetical protein n=1 Tax=Streptomyces sp. NPDC006175 TaxID=3154471 RepID=UPI0033B75DF0
MTARQTRLRPGVMALYAGVGLSVALTGCGGGSDDARPQALPSRASSAASVSASVDPEAVEETAVLAAYNAMSREQMAAYRPASAEGTELERYVTADALGQIRNDLHRMREAGTVVRGELGHDAEVTELDMDAQTPTASLSDCVDLARYETYDTRARTVIPLPSEQPLRYVMTATAQRWDGRWMVTGLDTRGGQTC